MTIKQSVINTFDRIGLDYRSLIDRKDKVEVSNWITGETCETSPLVAECINWVYRSTGEMERGSGKISISDFDRIRYFILDQDKNAYYTCID